MIHGIKIIEEKTYNLNGEVVGLSYFVEIDRNYKILKVFESYSEAIKFVTENYLNER